MHEQIGYIIYLFAKKSQTTNIWGQLVLKMGLNLLLYCLMNKVQIYNKMKIYFNQERQVKIKNVFTDRQIMLEG